MDEVTGSPVRDVLASAPDDRDLLKAFEPVIRFTRGEYFFPVSVERYVARASLWSDDEADGPHRLAAVGELDLARLASRGSAGEGIGESLSGVVAGERGRVVTIPVRDRPARLRGGSRLAAVGLLARLIDALNRVSLVFRGSVPGGSAARSYLLQRDHLAPEEPTYYGRVIREGGWIVCQYWYFYSFNNWRSGFGGVNEHEADWEQVTVYLDGSGPVDARGLPPARWVVFSAHDETGDDLRRRWDDPDLTVVDHTHPVVFAGAGSHSGAYLAGDYLITVPAPTLGGLVRVFRWLGQLIVPWSHNAAGVDVGIPYVDYARGDGRTCGPGGDPWTAVPVDNATDWVRNFRGLWGHDTRDRLGGERGPAGPRYERDGTVRESWADPIGWAGLAKVAPNPVVEREFVTARVAELDEKLITLDEEVTEGRRQVATAAARLAPGSPEVRALATEEERLLGLRMQATQLRDEQRRILQSLDEQPAIGPHAHLHHRRLPLEKVSGVRARALAGWAVISTPVLLYAIGVIIGPRAGVSVSATAATWIVTLLLIEGLLRNQFLAVLGRIGFLVLLLVGLHYAVQDWRIVLAVAFYLASALLLIVNLRDVWRR
jgi:hypothetical protein